MNCSIVRVDMKRPQRFYLHGLFYLLINGLDSLSFDFPALGQKDQNGKPTGDRINEVSHLGGLLFWLLGRLAANGVGELTKNIT